MAVALVELSLHVDAQLHRHVPFEHARDHVVVLGAQHDRRRGARSVVPAGHKHGAVLADARPQQHADAGLARDARDALRIRIAAPPSAPPSRRRRLVVGRARIRAIPAHEVGQDRLRHHDRAFQGIAHRLDLVRGLAGEPHRRGDDLAGGRRRPALGVANERHVTRLDHLERELLERPAPRERPRLEARVGQAVRRQSIPREIGGAFVRGRPGQARADVDGEHVEHWADLRALGPFGAHLREHVPIGGRLSVDEHADRRAAGDEKRRLVHGALRISEVVSAFRRTVYSAGAGRKRPMVAAENLPAQIFNRPPPSDCSSASNLT